MPETSLLPHRSLSRAWDVAAKIVREWPWLDVSWMAHPGSDFHLVVHEGPHGAALHFDDDAGPMFVEGERLVRLGWSEILQPDGEVERLWGRTGADVSLNGRTAALAAASQLISAGPRWMVRPARFISEREEGLSIDAIVQTFPTVAGNVDAYWQLLNVQLRDGELRGAQEYWHDPLWVVTLDNVIAALLDEDGMLHTPATGAQGPQASELARDSEGLIRAVRELVQLSEAGVRNRRLAHPQFLRVCIDLGSAFNGSTATRGPSSSARDTEVHRQHSNNIDPDFVAVFGKSWWDRGVPMSVGPEVRWTFVIGAPGDDWGRLVSVFASDQVGYFFTGGRLLVDRFFDGSDCDIFITKRDSPRVREEYTEVIRIGSIGIRSWGEALEAIARRVNAR